MKVILDPQAGTCGGVRRAIQLAEKELSDRSDNVLVLGDIIHNEREVERLDRAGLRTIHTSDICRFESVIGELKASEVKVLVRAHGEPPETFAQLDRLGVEVVDGTCPVVTRSQDLARKYQERRYQVAIVGKHHHPEMIGIVGHAGSKAIIIQHDEDLARLKPGVPTMVMAQTTVSPAMFEEMTGKIRRRVGEVVVKDTLCRFVVRRNQKLPAFANQAGVILVVGGRKSSNTKMLHSSCLAINPRSYHVISTDEIQAEWFDKCETIGVTGSASTPLWILHEFVETLESWIEQGWPHKVELE